MDSESSAPPVVAVVVAAAPGSWFEETLAALGAQDYPNLSILVIDAGGRDDLTARVAGAVPAAYVRRLEHPDRFGAAANQVIGVVEGAAYYLLCHDDVAPDTDALRLLVEEAVRSNAGIVGPKLVDWHDPRQLLAVGAGADRVGVVHPLVDSGELDQEQHDSPRDVFVVPSGAVLVRADLFEALGGFDPLIVDHGEDLDLCWRAQVLGARVLVAPAARIRHLEATRSGLRPGRPPGPTSGRANPLEDEHRLRTLVTCSSAVTLGWLLPLALLFLAGEAVTALASGHPGQALEAATAPGRAWRRPRRLLRSRRTLQRRRSVRDRDLRRRQSSGNARFRAWFRERLERPHPHLPFAATVATTDLDDDDAWFGPRPAEGAPRRDLRRRGRAGRRSLEPASPAEVATVVPVVTPSPEGVGPGGADAGRWRLPITVAAVIAVVLLVGSRELLTHELPMVGSLPDTSGGIGDWWRAWLSTWQPAGLGSVGPSAPALGLLSVAGAVLLGATGTLQHVLVLGPLVLGPIGAYRLARPWGGQRGRVVALVAYVAVPLPYDALARGDWDALVFYAAAPWVLAALARLSDALPHPSTRGRGIAGRVVGLAILTALVAAVAPSFLVVVAVAAASLALGSLLVGQVQVAARTLGVGVAASVVAFVLLLPWSAGVAGHASTLFGVAPSGSTGESFGALLRFDAGPLGSGLLGWGLLVAAALPLVIGRSWRLAWAARLWIVALVAVAWAWAGGRDLVAAPAPQVVLAVAAAALAGAAALGAIAFEQDLPGYRFGWRQAASAVAALGLVVTAVPVLVGSLNGRWQMPSSGAGSALGSLDAAPGGDYRVLWVGAPGALPLAALPLGDGFGWATSFDGMPTVTDEWSDGAASSGATIVADLNLVEDGRTTALGHLLAPLGVRYLVVPDLDGPASVGGATVATPRALLAGLAVQTDLQLVNATPGYTVYANASWAPVRAVLSSSAAAIARRSPGPRTLEGIDLGGSAAALRGRSDDRATGDIAPATTVYVSATDDPAWRLEVAGARIRPTRAFGTAMIFSVPATSGGPAVLTIGTDAGERAVQILEVLVALAAVAFVIADRWRRTRPGAEVEAVRAEWFAPLEPERGGPRRPHRRPAGSTPTPDEEEWVDG